MVFTTTSYILNRAKQKTCNSETEKEHRTLPKGKTKESLRVAQNKKNKKNMQKKQFPCRKKKNTSVHGNIAGREVRV